MFTLSFNNLNKYSILNPSTSDSQSPHCYFRTFPKGYRFHLHNLLLSSVSQHDSECHFMFWLYLVPSAEKFFSPSLMKVFITELLYGQTVRLTRKGLQDNVK